MEIKRKPLQGVLNILNFNRHFYYYGISALLLLLLGMHLLNLPMMISILVVVGFSYGLLMPLLVSAYVYDFSDYYTLPWLDRLIGDSENTWKLVNINAGFDETSYLIKNELVDSDLQVYDFYNEALHTEPAIVRARKVSLVYPNTVVIDSNAIPEKDGTVDVVFLLSSAHEIRGQAEKIAFLSECRRMCKPKGKLIMIEHLRDVPNFLAFTIGFNHFFSRKVWLSALSSAGFTSVREEKFTPFMSIFECRP